MELLHICHLLLWIWSLDLHIEPNKSCYRLVHHVAEFSTSCDLVRSIDLTIAFEILLKKYKKIIWWSTGHVEFLIHLNCKQCKKIVQWTTIQIAIFSWVQLFFPLISFPVFNKDRFFIIINLALSNCLSKQSSHRDWEVQENCSHVMGSVLK